MPVRRVYDSFWRSGLTFHLEEDSRRFMEAVYEMPLEFVAAFELDRDNIANALIAGGKVRGLDTARTYATEILGRMIWMKSIKGQEIIEEGIIPMPAES